MNTKLTGNYRDTGDGVNFNDKIGRKWGIEFLKQVFDIDAKGNIIEKKIDLLHTNIEGGTDVEEGKWSGFYRDQSSEIFNQYTHPIPTANFQGRKEKYIIEELDYLNDYGNLITSKEPFYQFNKITRFNSDGSEVFVVDHTLHSKIMYGEWATSSVYRVNEYGKKIKEHWISWPLNMVSFYIKKDGIWIKDNTLENPEVYNALVEKYQKERNKFLSENK